MNDDSETDMVPANQSEAKRIDSAHRQRIEALVRAIDDKLVRALRARTRSSQDAREIAQETYAVLLDVDHPSEIRDLKQFAFAVAMNRAKNRLIQGARRNEIEAALPSDDQDRRSPELIWEARDDFEKLVEVANELPPLARDTLKLHLDGEVPAVIARYLGIHPRSVRRYLALAVERLGKALGHDKRGGRKS
ncbi:MAG: sigma-70 family RNA polymerase sigma factor [Steroidobacter sp.]